MNVHPQQPANREQPARGQRRPIESAHPHVLAMVAHLFGHAAPAAESARILELGCADGGHLVPLAVLLPQATLVGIDPDAASIGAAQAFAQRMGLRNVTFQHAHWNDVVPDAGQFDYILCHDLFSSIPSAAQRQLLALCKRLLTAGGIAYFSYQISPGRCTRSFLGELMRYHVHQFSEPAQCIARARSILRLIADAAHGHPFGPILRDEAARLSAMQDAQVAREWLDTTHTPVYFHAFADMLQESQLQYLGEADFTRMMPSHLAPDVANALHALSGNDLLMMEQYLDFINGHDFRQSLVCHGDVVLDRQISPHRLNALCVSSQAVEQAKEGAASETITFAAPDGGRITTSSPSLQRALRWLAQHYPARVRTRDLLTALGLLADTEREQLQYELLLCVTSGIVRTSLHPHVLPPHRQHPVAWPVARDQARRLNWASNRLHQVMELEALPMHAAALIVLDGTHDVDDVNRLLVRRALDGRLCLTRNGAVLVDPEALRLAVTEWLPEILRDLGTLGFLTEN